MVMKPTPSRPPTRPKPFQSVPFRRAVVFKTMLKAVFLTTNLTTTLTTTLSIGAVPPCCRVVWCGLLQAAHYDVHGRAFENVELLPYVDSMWTCEGIDFRRG